MVPGRKQEGLQWPIKKLLDVWQLNFQNIIKYRANVLRKLSKLPGENWEMVWHAYAATRSVLVRMLRDTSEPIWKISKETEKATETIADDSSKGPGMQETVSNSGNTSGENTEKADLIGPGV